MTSTEQAVAPLPPRRPSLTLRDVRDIYTALARIETKIDALPALSDKVDDHEVRLIKLEAFMGTVLWIVGGGGAGIVALVAGLIKLGVL